VHTKIEFIDAVRLQWDGRGLLGCYH